MSEPSTGPKGAPPDHEFAGQLESSTMHSLRTLTRLAEQVAPAVARRASLTHNELRALRGLDPLPDRSAGGQVVQQRLRQGLDTGGVEVVVPAPVVEDDRAGVGAGGVVEPLEHVRDRGPARQQDVLHGAGVEGRLPHRRGLALVDQVVGRERVGRHRLHE